MIQGLGAALEGRYRIERELGAGGMAKVYLGYFMVVGRPTELERKLAGG